MTWNIFYLDDDGIEQFARIDAMDIKQAINLTYSTIDDCILVLSAELVREWNKI